MSLTKETEEKIVDNFNMQILTKIFHGEKSESKNVSNQDWITFFEFI